ncbi:OmpH family outer membrane protein [Parathalassolituus penaei]|uniref:OmpH family outer membrane protein n=1 Tax=Parathalassolituus penaei TaxID=2997323 RepID=A0A9X3IQS6_9GAMM|nr:OmpH family outer membrane protein [Parathalassolituus penaei]MCY0964101.1 OmpH family outer membrane protein [Parathalassolituus penaei]
MRGLMLLVAALMFSGAAAADTKIAVVDMERALFLSDAAKAAAAQFEKDNKADITKLDSLEKSLRDAKAKLDKDADVMSKEEREKRAGEYQQQLEEYKFFSGKLQQLDQKWKRDFFAKNQANLETKLKAIIDEGKYDVVLTAGAAIYVAPTADITKQLLERLNSK